MDPHVFLQNEHLKVEISPLGAEIQSILDKDGTQRLWNGDAEKYLLANAKKI